MKKNLIASVSAAFALAACGTAPQSSASASASASTSASTPQRDAALDEEETAAPESDPTPVLTATLASVFAGDATLSVNSLLGSEVVVKVGYFALNGSGVESGSIDVGAYDFSTAQEIVVDAAAIVDDLADSSPGSLTFDIIGSVNGDWFTAEAPVQVFFQSENDEVVLSADAPAVVVHVEKAE